MVDFLELEPAAGFGMSISTVSTGLEVKVMRLTDMRDEVAWASL